MWAIGWIAEYPDPKDLTTLQFGKGSPYNNSNYGQNKSSDTVQQQQVQQQLAQADVNTDANARFQMYNQAEQQLVNDVAWLPMFQSNAARLLKPYVVGRVYTGLGLVRPNDWANVFIAQH
jgi:peptide/nickel transport system substrate-binding protein/oligopeptide transport system substrate-binding protein